ncbi:MAG: M23 family metallopeptidase [Rickettsiales bacterium]|nr:M23 family metallopeptidase [Rickettsiales bacterium]
MTDRLGRFDKERIEKMLRKADGSLNDAAFMGVGAVFSAMLMVVTLSIATLEQSGAVMEMEFADSQEAVAEEQTVNIRDALVAAWKNLELKDPIQQTTVTEEVIEITADEIAAQAVPAAPEIIYPVDEKLSVKVNSGDTMAEIFQRQNIGIDDTNLIIKAMKKHFNPRNIRVGQTFDLELTRQSAEKSILTKFEVKTGKLTHVEVLLKGETFAAKKITVETNKQIARAGGVISSSFYEAGDDAGLPRAITSELVKAYSYDIDFGRDIKPGQTLDVLFEQLVSKDTGEVVGHGDLKYAAFKLKTKPVEIYKYTDRKGNTGYYKPNGESVRKALLKTPVNARISSKFGMRKHPILGYSKMHTGIDFAARSGTPIYAAGDGQINYAGRKGGYGNYIKIKHNGKYETAYAHMKNFAKGMRNGRRVKQGQVIGYVGSTGRSTGPHLHYEILKSGKRINPNGAKFRTGRVLKGKDLVAFKKEKTKLKNQLAALPRIREQVAQASE